MPPALRAVEKEGPRAGGPRASFFWLPDAAHEPHRESPEVVFEAIVAFVGGLPPVPPARDPTPLG